jgi:hypothetical protein
MTKAVYALLVGVNEYEGRANRLKGCVDDIRGFERFLRVHVPNDQLHILMLTDSQATRHRVIDGFTRHLTQAGPEDVAVFYFSGHGSTERVEEHFWFLEPTGRQQTIVCFDSRKPGIPDLADKEINELIGAVSARAPHVLVVLDCCHSGGATRGVDVRIRAADPIETPRHVEEFLPGVRAALLAALRDGGTAPTGELGEQPRQVALSACESRQLSKELQIGDRHRGVFSTMLQRALTTLGPGATYRDLLQAASAGVRDQVLEQDPVGYAVPVDAIDQPLFGGVVQLRDHSITLEHYRDQWWINVGTVHGIQPPSDGDTTVLAVLSPDDGVTAPPRTPLGRVRVTALEPSRCQVATEAAWQPDPGMRYPVVVVDVPTPPATVEILGDAAGVALVRAALAGSPHVHDGMQDPGIVGDRFVVIARPVRLGDEVRLVITRPDGTILAAPVPATEEGAATAIRRLEHLARWHLIKRLDNPGSSIANTLGIEIVPAQRGEPAPPPHGTRPPIRPGADGRIHLHYRRVGTAWQPPYVWIYLRNSSSRDLYCTLLNLTDRYRCHSRLFPGTLLPAGATTVAFDGRPVDVSVPQHRLDTPSSEVFDWLKLIASEQRFAPERYELPNLDGILPPRSATRAAGPRTVLDRLADRVVTRDAGDEVLEAPEWTTALVTLRTFGPSVGEDERQDPHSTDPLDR